MVLPIQKKPANCFVVCSCAREKVLTEADSGIITAEIIRRGQTASAILELLKGSPKLFKREVLSAVLKVEQIRRRVRDSGKPFPPHSRERERVSGETKNAVFSRFTEAALLE